MPATTWDQGWSEGAWGFNGWDGISPAYELPGVSGTGAVGAVVLRIDSNVTVDGVEGIGQIGGFIPQFDNVVIPDALPVVGTGEVGTVGLSVGKVVFVNGVKASGVIGSSIPELTYEVTGVEAVGDVGDVGIFPLSGVAGFGAVNDVSFLINSNIDVNGVEGTGSAGVAIPTPQAVVTGVSGVGAVSGVAIQIDDGKLVTGVQGVGAVGEVQFRKWSQISTFQNPNWSYIDQEAA